MTEAQYQAKLIRTLRRRFPGCIVIKNDPAYLQGVPDLTVLWKHRWATLETKISVRAIRQPNQEFFIKMMDKMSFAAFIYPSNEEEVLLEMEHAFLS